LKVKVKEKIMNISMHYLFIHAIYHLQPCGRTLTTIMKKHFGYHCFALMAEVSLIHQFDSGLVDWEGGQIYLFK
jgi:hypothetical protein